MATQAPIPKIPRPRRSHQRGIARLAAVQALYQIDVTDTPVEDVVGEFVRYRLADADTTGEEDGGEAERRAGTPEAVDLELFLAIVRGAAAELPMLDEMIGNSLASGWSITRMDKVLLAILRAGAWELFARQDVPPRVAITEYVDIAHAFFEGKEPGFVNGVLDKLAHLLRPEDMAPRE
jgi:N utilization substance protein B